MMSRCRSFLPDLMTVRAVMVRAAMETKKKSLPMGWMILTGQVTCFGRAEGTVGISGWLTRGLADFLILPLQGSLHPLDWNISSMRLP